jgi:hypothetical protein
MARQVGVVVTMRFSRASHSFDAAVDPFAVPAVGSVELVELEYDRGIVLGGLLPEERALASLLFAREPQFRLQ